MRKIEDAQIRAAIGLVVRNKRIRMGLSQNELSKRANISRNFVALIESGRRLPSYDKLSEMAVALDTDVTSFMAAAKVGKVDPEVRLAHLLARLIKSGDRDKMEKLAKIMESIS